MPVCFEVLCIVAFSLSILSSILLNLLLRNNKSNYSKLMKYICLSEAIFIYCEFICELSGINYRFRLNEHCASWDSHSIPCHSLLVGCHGHVQVLDHAHARARSHIHDD